MLGRGRVSDQRMWLHVTIRGGGVAGNEAEKVNYGQIMKGLRSVS